MGANTILDFGAVPSGRTDLTALYSDAYRVKGRHFDPFFKRIVEQSHGEWKKGNLKHIYRAVEKTSMKKAGDPMLGAANNVCDIVRGMAVYSNFLDMDSAVEMVQKAEARGELEILRTKSRFAQPTSGGWRDLVLNIRFTADRSKHVCEVQFVHSKLLLVRHSALSCQNF
jgi:hypothetical protein